MSIAWLRSYLSLTVIIIAITFVIMSNLFFTSTPISLPSPYRASSAATCRFVKSSTFLPSFFSLLPNSSHMWFSSSLSSSSTTNTNINHSSTMAAKVDVVESDWLSAPPGQKLPVVGDESIMDQKDHGTSSVPVQENLRYNCDSDTADRICNFNRHYAEHAGYAFVATTWLEHLKEKGNDEPTVYYDSNTGKPLFKAPVGRTLEEFIAESKKHGWPSFRDQEVNWKYVRCLPDGECVSVDGTHLGHNLPDRSGNRYCINLVCVAGNPTK